MKLKYWSLVQPIRVTILIRTLKNYSQARRCIIYDMRGTRGLTKMHNADLFGGSRFLRHRTPL